MHMHDNHATHSYTKTKAGREWGMRLTKKKFTMVTTHDADIPYIVEYRE